MSASRNIQQLMRSISGGLLPMPVEPADSTPSALPDIMSPLSPSSKYTTSSIDIPNQNFIHNIVLSHWDNILGPRVIHVWNLSGSPVQHSATLNHITSQTLSGEICRDVYNSYIDFKFYDLSKEDILVAAFIFTATGKSGAGVHAVSVIIPKSQLQTYLSIHTLFTRCFQRAVGRLRILMNKNELPSEVAYERFARLSTGCIQNLCFLQIHPFPQKIKLSETYLCPSHHLDRDFLCRCISCHLTSFSHTYIIGNKADQVNMMMKTLALFNSSQERMCSSLVSSNNPTSYHHDLWLQGSCQEDDSNQLPVQEILYSQFPTSVINLGSKGIKQSPKFTDHVVHTYNEHKNELIGLHNGDTDMNLPGRELFTDFDQADTFVHSLLDELDKLPADCGVREAYISQFVRVIQKKALCLIKYIEGETNYGAQPYRSGMRKLRQDLCIMSDGDFRIILAAAEKLKSGLYWFLFGNGDSIGRIPPSDVS